jgi:tRNA threonylcarbamoyladenosine biosynthesis protein TsaB
MATILSIETSTPVSSVAIHRQGGLLASQCIHKDQSHAENLLPSIHQLLQICKIGMRELDAIAVSQGPGSYTGLRIGTSTAKGFCFGTGARLIAINSLKAMAYGVRKYFDEDSLLCPMLDARRMEVYCMMLKQDLTVVEQTQARIIDENAFQEYLTRGKVVFFGDGAMKCKKLLAHSNALFIEAVSPSAVQIGAMAGISYKNEQFENVEYFEPLYLKDFIAKKPSRKNLV